MSDRSGSGGDSNTEISDGASEQRRNREQLKLDNYPHVEGLTRGTIVEYDDWQWAVISELAEEKEPTKVGFVLLDQLGDDIIHTLEDAWGCWEHYDAVKPYHESEHEYWTDAVNILNNDMWAVLGPIHPDAREVDQEVTPLAE